MAQRVRKIPTRWAILVTFPFHATGLLMALNYFGIVGFPKTLNPWFAYNVKGFAYSC